MTETSRGTAIIVGIGINLSAVNFPSEIAEISTSIENETNIIPSPGELLNTLTEFYEYFYNILQSAKGAEIIVEEWTRRSSYAFGKSVRVESGIEKFSGITDGLEKNGALRVVTADRELKIVEAGDVTQLREE